MRIVLLGAAGFTGQAVLRAMAQMPSEKHAHALIRKTWLASAHDFVSPHHGSMADLPTGLFPDAPHVVIHCASKLIDRDASGYADNLRGIDTLGKAINRHTRAILYASSFSVYGDGAQRGVTEDEPLRPESPLAESRAACEARLAQLAREKGIAVIACRTRFVIGTGDRHFLPGLTKLARSRAGIGNESQRFSIIDVDDYAGILLALARHALDGKMQAGTFDAFNVAYENPIALKDIRAILAGTGRGGRPQWRIPVHEGALRLLERLPSRGLRQLAQRLRLLGLDHYGAVGKLAARLGNDPLRTDPQQAVRRAAHALAVNGPTRQIQY